MPEAVGEAEFILVRKTVGQHVTEEKCWAWLAQKVDVVRRVIVVRKSQEMVHYGVVIPGLFWG